MLPTGMVSGALLQRFCPDNGQCKDGSGEGGGPARRLMSLLTGSGEGEGGRGWVRGLAETAAAAVAGAVAPASECDGRALWAIVTALTLSSPLLVLLTQVG